MANWKMLTLVGRDQTGIVATVTAALFEAGCNLGEAAMSRLGENFTIMMMVDFAGDSSRLKSILAPVSERMGLQVHADAVEGEAHLSSEEPNLMVRIHGADQAGIVSRATRVLMDAGVSITDLETAVGGTADKPFYIMTVEAYGEADDKALQQAMEKELGDDIKITVESIESMVG